MERSARVHQCGQLVVINMDVALLAWPSATSAHVSRNLVGHIGKSDIFIPSHDGIQTVIKPSVWGEYTRAKQARRIEEKPPRLV